MDVLATIRFPALAIPNTEPTPGSSSAASASADVVTSDEILLTRTSQGDREALSLLFRRYATTVRGLAWSILRDSSEADDLLQEIFLLIYRKCGSFDGAKGAARHWILQMTYHRAISHRRYLNSRHFYTRLNLEDLESDFTALHASSERYEQSIEAVLGNGALEKMFQALSENQSQTLRLFFQEGYTLDEIAAELGQSRDNVRHHYFRGLEKLRKQIFGGNSQTK